MNMNDKLEKVVQTIESVGIDGAADFIEVKVVPDKISFLLDGNDEGEKGWFAQTAYQLEGLLDQKVVTRRSDGRYKLSLQVFLPNGTTRFLIQSNPRNKSAAAIRIELNPSQMTQQDWVFVSELLETIFCFGETQANAMKAAKDRVLGLAYIVNHARVSRLDCAVDLVGLPTEAPVFRHRKFVKSHIYSNRAGVQTLYLGGTQKGNAPCRVYDKRAEQIARKRSPEHGDLPHTRIELIKRPSNKSLLMLASGEVGFDDVGVSYPKGVSLNRVAKIWPLIRDAVHMRGYEEAVAIEAYSMGKFLQRIVEQGKTYDIWQPERLEASFRDALWQLAFDMSVEQLASAA